jgi:hypothetical protein
MGISPMIWRPLLVSGDCTITDLHYILQIAMEWSDNQKWAYGNTLICCGHGMQFVSVQSRGHELAI